MRIALCLITCERYDYTALTLKTLAEHNDLKRFVLIHADDASTDERIGPLVRGYGFQTYRSTERFGVMATQRLAVMAARDAGCEWTLIQQNDFEWVRPFPWQLFNCVVNDKQVYCMRLYGHRKGRQGRLANAVAGPRHKGKDGAVVDWQPYRGTCFSVPDEPAEIGDVHWCSPPAVTRTDVLWWLLDGALKDADCRLKSGELDLMTVRPVENVVWHIGEERTPNFQF